MPLIRNEEIIKIKASGLFILKQTIRNALSMERYEWQEVINLLSKDKIGDEDEHATFSQLYQPYRLAKKIPIPIAIIIIDYVAPEIDYIIKR